MLLPKAMMTEGTLTLGNLYHALVNFLDLGIFRTGVLQHSLVAHAQVQLHNVDMTYSGCHCSSQQLFINNGTKGLMLVRCRGQVFTSNWTDVNIQSQLDHMMTYGMYKR